MNNEKQQFFNQRIWPHRIGSTEVAWIMGFPPEDIPILVANKLLKPIGEPVQNSIKFFATVQVEKLRSNVRWLSKATVVLNQHYRDKNAKQVSKKKKGTRS